MGTAWAPWVRNCLAGLSLFAFPATFLPNKIPSGYFFRVSAFSRVLTAVLGAIALGFVTVIGPFGLLAEFTRASTVPSPLVDLDAGNSESYPGSGTVWTNLVDGTTTYTIQNGAYTSANGGAIEFNGSNTRVDLGAVLDDGASFTKEAWVLAEGSGSRNIVSSSQHPFYVNSTSDLCGGLAGNFCRVSGPSFPNHVWKHVALTFDNPNDTMSLYVDGARVGETTGITHNYTSEDIFIGSHVTSSWWDGLIAKVRIYDAVLNDGQVEARYDATKADYLSSNITIVSSGGASENEGWSVSSGVLTATRDVSINADDIEAELASGDLVVRARNVIVNGAVSYTGTASTLTLQADQRVMVDQALESTTNALNIVLWSDYDDTNNGGVSIGADISTNGGHLWAGGSSTESGSLTWNGLAVGDGPSVGVSTANNYAFDLNEGDISTTGGDVVLWAGTGSDHPSLNYDGFGVRNAVAIDAGSGNVTLITEKLFDFPTGGLTGDGDLSVTTTGTLAIAPPGPDAWTSDASWAGSFTGSSFELDNIGGEGLPLTITDISSLGGLVIGDDLNAPDFVDAALSNFDLTTGIDINGPISISAGNLVHPAGVSVTSGGSDIAYTVVGSPWTADSDKALAVGHTGTGTAVIDAEGGNVSLSASFATTGTNNDDGSSTGDQDVTIDIGNSEVRTSASGTVSIVGDASNNTSAVGNYVWGVVFRSGAVIESDTGDIAITGTAGASLTNARGIVSNGTDLKVVSDSGEISFTDAVPDGFADGVSYTGMYLNPTSSDIKIGADGSEVSSSSSDIVFDVDRLTLASGAGSTVFNSAGSLTVQPVADSFSSTFTLGNHSLSNLTGLTLGKAGNTSAVTINGSTTVSGPIAIFSDAISVQAALAATNDTITFQGAGSDDSKGTLSNTSDGTITADNLLIRNIHNASLRSHENVSVNTVASAGGHRLLLANDQALEVGTVSGVNGVSATEWVAIDTTTGDLSITQPVGTTLTTSSWGLRLRAGTATAFGTASGGDVTVSGSGAINVPNAQTQVFSGSAAGSTGLSAFSTSEVVSEVAPTVAAGEVGVAYRAGPPAFSSATTMRFDDELTLLATDPAGGSVTYSKVSGDCSLDGSTVEPTGVGDCVMRATASGSGLTTDTTISISKAPQSIAFTSSVPTSAVSGTRYTPSATATSGLTVEFAITSGSPSVCTLAGGVVEFQSAGSCTIEASIADGQSGAANYLAATAVSQTIVAGKINQTISFSVIADRNYGDPSFTAGATVSSGRTVTYSSPGSSSSVCRVNSSTGVVDILDVGDCTITASSEGDSSYASAADVTRTFTVRAVVPGKASLTSASFGDQRITVGFIAPESNGGAAITGYRAVATPAGGGSAIQQTCGSVSPCTVTGLTNGTEYTVTLAAINSAGLASASDASPAVTPATAPESVSNLRTSPGNQQLVVAWTRAEDFGCGTFTAYEVYLRESGQSWPGSATQTMSSESDETVTLTGLTNGTAYDVKVVTVSSANQTEIAGTNLAVAFGVPVTVADAPTGLSVTALSSTTALASWKAPADNGGTVITAYSVSPGCDFDTATDTYCTLTGLTPSSSVTVSVGATNFVGTGATTQAVVAMPAAPRNDSGSNDSDDSDDSPAQVVAPPMSPSAVPTADQPRRLPVGPGPAVRPDVVTGPVQLPGGPSGPLANPRGFVGGIPAPVRTTPSADGGFDVSTSTLRLGLRPGVTPGGSASVPGENVLPGVTPGDSTGASSESMRLLVPQGGSTTFRGGGLLPGSSLQVFLPGSSGGGGGAELARIPVNTSGEFDGEVGFGRNLDQMPMPIGEQVLQAVGYDENGNQVVVELPVNIAQGAPTPEWDREAGAVPGLTAGQVLATSAGLPESVTITALPEIGQVNAVAGDWSFSIRVAEDAGSVEQAGSSANVRLIRDRAAEASGSGFQPGTRVDMWLFSEPTLLGSVTVGDDGEFVGEFFLDPRFATVGEHTLQLQGVGTDGFVKAVNMGVSVDDAVGATSTGANTLLWWALGVFLAIVIALVLFALLSRRSQRA